MRLTLTRYLSLIGLLAAASVAMPQNALKPLPLHNPIQDKNFYLLTLFESDFGVRQALADDVNLKEVSGERARFLKVALQSCKVDAPCTAKAFLWTDEEIGAVSRDLMRLYHGNESVRRMVDETLKRSDAYELYNNESGTDLLANAWEICARGMNDVISVYGEGAPPRYPRIDSISFDVTSADFQQRIASLAQRISTESSEQGLFFSPSLSAALELLQMNHRDEAGRIEPMETGANAAAVKAIPRITWAKYPYTVIVVPGAGPNDPNTALSEAGRRRTQLAAEAYHEGKAPLILVSGGFVHPSQTRFSEALEMKKALLNDYHVPESAILVDPHARHTTTNMRNAAREIFRYRVPTDKPALMISDSAQTGYIAGQGFADRCMKELGYVPYKIVQRTSDTSIVFFPLIESLQQDPMDPLDP